jgi:hypothetical protein
MEGGERRQEEERKCMVVASLMGICFFGKAVSTI